MAKKKAREPRNRPDSEKKNQRPKRPVVTSEPSSGPTRAPASTPALGFEPELIFIPGGRFTMGSDRTADRYAYDNEHPQHQVSVADFYIARYPVTNAEYQRFVEATGHRMPPHLQSQFKPLCEPEHPVVWVSWEDASVYCQWLSQATGRSYRLPTEAEWEKAARGTDGRPYPWGNELPDKSRCAFANDVGATTTPVARYSPRGDSPYGCADMAGNMWEWCHSLYKPYPYDPEDGREDPGAKGPRVLRGGAFYVNLRRVRCASRLSYFPDLWLNVIGFRVVVVPAAQ
jgi:formylglycine-generating enzyme required for sulfatase activity